MRVLRNISFWLAVILCTASCSTIRRALTVCKDKPDVTAEEFTKIISPDGILEDITYRCSIDGPSSRRAIVYLPEEYRSDTLKRFSVLYLIHGARGNETSWITEGDIIHCIDSLRRNGLAGQFILVLPNMNQYDDDADFGNSRFKKMTESYFETNGAVESAFMRDVVKYVDSLYRTMPDKKHRAIAGLSIGAMQAMYISAANPDSFGAIGLFSPTPKCPIHKSPYSDFYSGLKGKQKLQFADAPEHYNIYIGHHDIYIQSVDSYKIYLSVNKFPFKYTETAGGHGWNSWKDFSERFIKVIFPVR